MIEIIVETRRINHENVQPKVWRRAELLYHLADSGWVEKYIETVDELLSDRGLYSYYDGSELVEYHVFNVPIKASRRRGTKNPPKR